MRGVDGDRSVGWLKFSSALTAPFSLNNGEGKDKKSSPVFLTNQCTFSIFCLFFVSFILFWLHWIFVQVRGFFPSCNECAGLVASQRVGS